MLRRHARGGRRPPDAMPCYVTASKLDSADAPAAFAGLFGWPGAVLGLASVVGSGVIVVIILV